MEKLFTSAMSTFKYTMGLNHVPSYQASSRPYLTSSLTVPASGSTPMQVSFDSVSRFVIITNTLGGGSTNVPLRFGFSENGVKGIPENNYAILNNGESFEAEFKVTSIYLMSNNVNECSASVVAGLTGIGWRHLENNWTGSSGVG